MFLPCLARPLGYLLSIGFLVGAARAAGPAWTLARDVLGPDDGWAAVATAALPLGTTGGSNAAAARTVTVTNRNELIAALAWPDAAPKLIYIKGTIDVNVDDALKPLTCKDYRRSGSRHRRDCIQHLRLSRHVRPGGPAGQDEKRPFRRPGKCARGFGSGAGGARAHPHSAEHHFVWRGRDATLVGASLDIGGPRIRQPAR